MSARGAWSGGSTRRWRALRAVVLHRDRRPDGTHRCGNCGRTVHRYRRCLHHPKGCGLCLHVHHLDGTQRQRPDRVHPSRLAVWCADCNYATGDPTTNTTRTIPTSTPPNPMRGVAAR